MRLNELFLGKPSHWALWVIIGVLGYAFNSVHLHVVHFNRFIFALLAMAAAALGWIVYTYRPGEKITREPITEADRDAEAIPWGEE